MGFPVPSQEAGEGISDSTVPAGRGFLTPGKVCAKNPPGRS